MKGFGTVITGSSLSGRISVGDEVEFYPSQTVARIRGIQVHARDVDMVEAGHRTAINLQGVEKNDINRGDIAATPGSLVNSTLIDADFHYLGSNPKKLKNRTQVRVHVGTREITGRIIMLEDDSVEPGNDINIQLILQDPVALWPGDRYVLRSYSPVRTIGGGTILNNAPIKRKRAVEKDRQKNRQVFAVYRDGTIEERMLLFLEEAGQQGLTLDQLATRLGLFGKKLKKQLQKPVSAGQILIVDSDRQRMIAAPVLQRLTDKIVMILQKYHADFPLKSGLKTEELRSGIMPPADLKVFQYALGSLVKKNIIVQDKAEVRLADFEVVLQVDEEALKKEILDIYQQAGLKPPNFKDVLSRLSEYPGNQVGQVFDLLLREKKLIKITEALYFPAETLDNLAGKITEFIRSEGEIEAQGFKELTGLSRKFSIPLMEYFDKIKLTIRIDDKRVLRKAQ